MRLFLTITTFLFTAPVAWAVSYPPHAPAAGLEEFTAVEAIKFRDAQGTSPPTYSEVVETYQRFQW